MTIIYITVYKYLTTCVRFRFGKCPLHEFSRKKEQHTHIYTYIRFVHTSRTIIALGTDTRDNDIANLFTL